MYQRQIGSVHGRTQVAAFRCIQQVRGRLPLVTAMLNLPHFLAFEYSVTAGWGAVAISQRLMIRADAARLILSFLERRIWNHTESTRLPVLSCQSPPPTIFSEE